MSALIFLIMLYNLIFGCTLSWLFCLISIPYMVFFHCIVVTFTFILICLWMFYLCLLWYVCVFNIICSLVVLHLWEDCNQYLLYMICYAIFIILVDLYSHKWIDISLFELVVTCIEKHIIVPSLSISNIFISIITFFCCLLLLSKIFTLDSQRSKTCNQHHIYTIFDKIPNFSCLIFGHTRLECVSITAREGVLYFIFQVKRISALVYVT